MDKHNKMKRKLVGLVIASAHGFNSLLDHSYITVISTHAMMGFLGKLKWELGVSES
jgi:hypothetical protein